MKYWKDKYYFVDYFYEGRARVIINDKFGFVDKDGNEVVPPKYEWANDFNDGRAIICFIGCYGEIDLNGREYFNQEDLPKLRKHRLPGIINSL
jgi:hypothetical protein